jgi:hypothetical protein
MVVPLRCCTRTLVELHGALNISLVETQSNSLDEVEECLTYTCLFNIQPDWPSSWRLRYDSRPEQTCHFSLGGRRASLSRERSGTSRKPKTWLLYPQDIDILSGRSARSRYACISLFMRLRLFLYEATSPASFGACTSRHLEPSGR